MHANVGDQLVIESNRVDSPRKVGEILEVQGEDGARRTSCAGPTGTRA